MYLNQILKSVSKRHSKIKLSGISFNSKTIKKDNIFFAIEGKNKNGEKYIKEAIKKGASVIVIKKKNKKINISIPIIYVKNPRKSLSEACSNFYKLKPKQLIAVTGTNGKTSVANFFYQILNLNKIPAATIGTLGIYSNKFKKKTNLTSMDPIYLHKNLQLLAKKKINNIILEASSHGLQQNRLDNLKFKIGIFTNFSHDHLDYHKTMKKYFDAKMYLFKSILHKNSKIITDRKNSKLNEVKKIASSRGLKLNMIHSNSGIEVLSHFYKENNQHIKIIYKKKIYELKIPLIGYLQCKNLLMSILAALNIGMKIDKIINILNKIKPVPGRLENIGKQKNNSKIILDYAHTPDALDQTLRNIKEHFKKEILIVFGCGGDRDKQKRSVMGNVAQKHCRKVFVTDDNPRNENPLKIRRMIIKNYSKKVIEIGNREKAIELAMNELNPNEILLVAGKGHEEIQDYGKYKIKLSDKAIIKKNLKLNNKIFKNYNWKFDIIKNSLLNKKVKKFSYKDVSINSKKIKKNTLFVAIKGKKKDGHNYVKSALKKGATKVVVNKKINTIKKNDQIQVKSTFNFLNNLAKITRKFSNAKFIGVTGSSGKTTLTNFLNHALSKYGKVYSSPKSFNNHYGVPLSVSNIDRDTNFGVFEMGMSKKGEIQKLSNIVKPNIGIITNISDAHIENFKRTKDIAEAKSEILNNIYFDGYIILNKDDKFYNFLYRKAKLKKLNILSFSLNKKSDIFLKKISKYKKNYKLTVDIKNKEYIFYANSNFNNFIQNLLSTILILFSMNLDLNIIKKTFLNFSIPPGRGDISNIFIYKKRFQLIDESYNANPLSMMSAIKNLNNYKKDLNKILIIGDMLELGVHSKKHHKLISNIINNTDINKVYVYGNFVKETFKNLKNNKKGKILKNKEDIKKIFIENIKNKDLVMIKGSNASGLFKITQSLKKGKINVL